MIKNLALGSVCGPCLSLILIGSTVPGKWLSSFYRNIFKTPYPVPGTLNLFPNPLLFLWYILHIINCYHHNTDKVMMSHFLKILCLCMKVKIKILNVAYRLNISLFWLLPSLFSWPSPAFLFAPAMRDIFEFLQCGHHIFFLPQDLCICLSISLEFSSHFPILSLWVQFNCKVLRECLFPT